MSPPVVQSAVRETLSITQLRNELLRDGEYTFKNKYPYQFLVLRQVPPDETGGLGIKTVETSAKALQEELARSRPDMALVLRKSDRNTYRSKITVGRAKNNDIIIRAPKISKLHGAFHTDKNGRVEEMVDMGSFNGTWINGVKLEKNKPTKLKDGDRVTFWRYEFELMDLDSFVDYLNTLV